MADLSIIRPLCKNKGMSLKSLAESLNLSEPGLQRILRTNSTKIETLEKIAEVLDINITEFFYPQGLIPDDDIFYTSFVKDPDSAILCKRYKKFSEKLSYYKDCYFLYIFPPDGHRYANNDIAVKLRYPFKHASRPKYIFKRGAKNIYPKIPNKIREFPFSRWPDEFKLQVKNNIYVLESFYFPVFYYNLLNIIDFLNEGIIKNKELVLYWEEWKKIENEAKLIKQPLFIDPYTSAAVYYDED